MLKLEDVQLFELLQVVRPRLLQWYATATRRDASFALEASVRVAASSGPRRLKGKAQQARIRGWQRYQHPRSCGRYTVSGTELIAFDDDTLDPMACTAMGKNTSEMDLDLQIMKLTVQQSHLRALDQTIAQDANVVVCCGWLETP